FAFASLPVLAGHATWRPDVVFLVAPTLLCAPAAWLFARALRAPAWIHFQDFELDAAAGLDMLRPPGLGVASRDEAWLLRKFHRVSTISPAMIRTLASKGVPAKRLELFPNWTQLEALYPDPAAGSEVRSKWRVSDSERVALYSGNMGEKQGLETVIDAARQL